MTTNRAFAAAVAVALCAVGLGWLLDAALLTFIGAFLCAIIGAIGSASLGRTAPAATSTAAAPAAPAAPAVPPPLGWSTPDQILDDMLGVANPPTPPPDIDPDTGELLGDRVCRIEEVLTGMERTIEQLGNLIGEQSNLMANGLLELRRRVDQLEPPPQQQVLPLREAS